METIHFETKLGNKQSRLHLDILANILGNIGKNHDYIVNSADPTQANEVMGYLELDYAPLQSVDENDIPGSACYQVTITSIYGHRLEIEFPTIEDVDGVKVADKNSPARLQAYFDNGWHWASYNEKLSKVFNVKRITPEFLDKFVNQLNSAAKFSNYKSYLKFWDDAAEYEASFSEIENS